MFAAASLWCLSPSLLPSSIFPSCLWWMDAQERGEWARAAVLTVFPSLVSPHFLLHHIAPFSTSPAQHGQQQLENCVRMCGKTKAGCLKLSEGFTSPAAETILLKEAEKDPLCRGQAKGHRASERKIFFFFGECEESAVPSYLQATGKLSLWLSGRPLPSLLFVCVWVCWLFCSEKRKQFRLCFVFTKPSYFFPPVRVCHKWSVLWDCRLPYQVSAAEGWKIRLV